MKKLSCESCGANLKDIEKGGVNVKCEYCGTIMRVVGEGAEQYDANNIINHIIELGSERKRGDDFNKDYIRAKDLIESYKFVEANDLLNDILDKDSTQARAWFYKALLPVLEQESVIFNGCYVNIRILSKITKREHISQYLSDCGLSWLGRRKFMKFYGSTDFLFEQQQRYLDKAIDNAAADERREFFIKQKKSAIKRQKSKQKRKWFGNFLLIIILAAVIAGCVFIFVREVIIDKL